MSSPKCAVGMGTLGFERRGERLGPASASSSLSLVTFTLAMNLCARRHFRLEKVLRTSDFSSEAPVPLHNSLLKSSQQFQEFAAVNSQQNGKCTESPAHGNPRQNLPATEHTSTGRRDRSSRSSRRSAVTARIDKVRVAPSGCVVRRGDPRERLQTWRPLRTT